jgi:putative spermidine/putrescine transport system substrate-binding protein
LALSPIAGAGARAQVGQGPDPAPLTIATWGGTYEAAQRAALFEPFTRATGIPIRTARHDGGVTVLRAAQAGAAEGADAAGWDLIDMIDTDADAACREGLLLRLDARDLADPAPDGTPVRHDFIAGAFHPCGLSHMSFSTVVAYDDRAFPGVKPRTIADVFDVERFPGKRAFRRAPVAILEWALMAEGVPRAQVYDLLSTDRGLRLALRRLDSIREHIVWWEETEEPVALLAAGEAVMASGYNGRFFAAGLGDRVPLGIIWDGQLISTDVWAIPTGSPHRAVAEQFIRFATHPDSLAALASMIPYGPTRLSALDHIGLHPQSGVPMRDHLPTAPHRLNKALMVDSAWYANTRALRRRRFEAWLAGAGAP